jgi:hypothetical protein
MSHHLNRQIHFQQSELQAIQRDQAHGRYNGFRNTFDEWETRKERAAEPVESDDALGEDELERLRSRGGSFGRQLRLGEAA